MVITIIDKHYKTLTDMKFMMSSTTVLTILIIFCLHLIPSCTGKEPPYALKIEPDYINLGNIQLPQDSIVSKEFKVRNIGDSTIYIMKLDVSCNCMEIIGQPDSIQPGDTKIYVLRMKVPNEAGKFSKNIYLRSNSKNQVDIIHVYGNIKPISKKT